jgi:hypothetical protein
LSKAIFTVGWKAGHPDLPPMVSEAGGLQLTFLNAKQERKGGFCVLNSDRAKLCTCLIFSSMATIKAMAADPSRYIFLEEHKDEGGEWIDKPVEPIEEKPIDIIKPGVKAMEPEKGPTLGDPVTIDPIATQPLRAQITPFLATCKVAYSTLPTTKEPITRWLKTAARATDEAIAAADMT